MNDFENIIMPMNITTHNATHERCDMFEGPCACGAWHHAEDWPEELRKLVQLSYEKNNI